MTTQYGYSVLAPTNLHDNAYSTNQTDYRQSSPLARWVFTTNARRMVVMAWSTLHPYFPAWGQIGVRLNGAHFATLAFSANGEKDFSLDLPAGVKTVELISGLQSRIGGVVYGTYLRNVYFCGGTSVTQSAPTTPPNRVVVYGDSIAVGANAATPTREAWTVLLRQVIPVTVEAWGWRALYDDAPNAAGRSALAAQLGGLSPGTIWLAIGTNDYGQSYWSAAAFGAAYADLLDKLHTALPSAILYCQTPLRRGTESANAQGSTLDHYRAQIAAAQAAHSTCCILVDGTAAPFPQYPADLDADFLHPTTAGQAKYAAAVRAVLGV